VFLGNFRHFEGIPAGGDERCQPDDLGLVTDHGLFKTIEIWFKGSIKHGDAVVIFPQHRRKVQQPQREIRRH